MYKSSSSRSLAFFIALECLNFTCGFRRHPSFFSGNVDQDIRSIHNSPSSSYQNDPPIIQQQIVESIEASTQTIGQDLLRRKLSLSDEDNIDLTAKTATTATTATRRQLLLKPDDHLVTDLPYLDSSVFTSKHYAGHIPASNNDDKKLFYWLFEPDLTDGDTSHKDGDIPLLIWLNGGPGCSSMDGLFLENGPFRLVKDSNNKESNPWTIQINQYSWHKAPAYVLYIDQPVGTGLSFTKSKKYCKNDKEINIDFHLFLENFLLMYEDFFLKNDPNENGQRTMSRPLYFSGESHAGHYIPSMMDYILQRNDDTSEDTSTRVQINLRGSAIGNGWIDPYYQYAAADLAYSVGMIDAAQKASLDDKERQCREYLIHGTYRSNVCFDLLDDIINDSSGKDGKTKMSIYDNRKWEERGKARSFPPGHKDVEAYLGGWHQAAIGMAVPYTDVLKTIHAEESIRANQRFLECTDPPYTALQYQDGKGVVKEFVRVLEHKTKPKMLIFNGMNDMICNHIGNEKLLDNLDWEHVEKWTLAKRYAWNYKSDFVKSIDGSDTIGPAGFYKEYENLTFLKIASSGHMVPMDLPDLSLDMMRKLMFQESFTGNYQRMGGKIPKSTECPTRENSTTHKNESNDDDNDDVEEADESRILFSTEFVSGGWFGAVIGMSIMVLYNVIKSRRSSESHFVISHDHENVDVSYRDDPETEMVLSQQNPINDGEYI